MLLGPGLMPHTGPTQTSKTKGVPAATATEIDPESVLNERSLLLTRFRRNTGVNVGKALKLIIPMVPVGLHCPPKNIPSCPPARVTRVIRISLLGTKNPPTWPWTMLPGKEPPTYMRGAAFMGGSVLILKFPFTTSGPPTVTPA